MNLHPVRGFLRASWAVYCKFEGAPGPPPRAPPSHHSKRLERKQACLFVNQQRMFAALSNQTAKPKPWSFSLRHMFAALTSPKVKRKPQPFSLRRMFAARGSPTVKPKPQSFSLGHAAGDLRAKPSTSAVCKRENELQLRLCVLPVYFRKPP